MNEKIIDIEKIDLVVLFGFNNRKLYKIREFFSRFKTDCSWKYFKSIRK